MTTTPRTSPEALAKIKEAAMQTYFAQVPRAVMASDYGAFILNQHVWQRYEQAYYSLAPWVNRAAGLAGRRLVEVGSGTGSSTAGFAPFVRRIDAYEIDAVSTDMAERRLKILQIGNASAHLIAGDQMVQTICERHRGQVDGFLLFAVLEHMTISERIHALTTAWRELPSGGIIVVIETPNRLTYTDLHTAHMPFFHMLPPQLAAQYYRFSARTDFVDAVSQAAPADREMVLQRWGNGVSFHEFDLAIGQGVDSCIRADGYEQEVVEIYPVRLDDDLLLRYFESGAVKRHRAWARNHLNMVFVKP
jgi:SAM-dependent methyltransferase